MVLYSNYPNTPPAFKQYAKSIETAQRLGEGFIGSGYQDSFFRGRPDFIVEVFDDSDETKDLSRVVIGEIKYSRIEKTFADGLRELIDYLHFAQENSRYIFGTDDVEVIGVLCTDGVETRTDQINQIYHMTTEDLLSRDPVIDMIGSS